MTAPTGGRRRFTQQAIAQAAQTPPIPDLPMADVVGVQAGAAAGGLALVTVNYLGATLPALYGTWYTPVVGHRVMVVKAGGVLTILGRPGGFPPIAGSG